MISKTLGCQIVTPLFLRGADERFGEIRPSSIKGALRFWWRATKGRAFDQGAEAFRNRESMLFGSSQEEIGRSRVTISLVSNVEPGIPNFNNLGPDKDVPVKHFKINILEYLSYGVYGRGVPVSPNCFIPDEKFGLQVLTRNKQQMEEVLDSFAVLMLFGGVGAKSRNGFGKIWISELEGRLEGLQDRFFQGSMSSYTTGSSNAYLFKTTRSYQYWDQALAEIGKLYRRARLSLEPKHDTSLRSLVASPVNEAKSTIGRGIKLQRHSKGIFLSVRPNQGKYEGYILLVPYLFLTDGDPDTIGKSIRDRLPQHAANYQQVYATLASFFTQSNLLKLYGK